MSDSNDHGLLARRARLRERRRAAHRAAAGLFLQQTIAADLASRGELAQDEAVELTRGTDGILIAKVTKID